MGEVERMNYLLSEAEYVALSEVGKIERERSRDNLQKVCTMVAKLKHRPYVGLGCVADNSAEYCDGCHVKKECPYEHKEFSK